LANYVTAGVFDLAVDPDNPKVLYASLYVPASSPATPDEGEESELADLLLVD
jgi:hypothetical protein